MKVWKKAVFFGMVLVIALSFASGCGRTQTTTDERGVTTEGNKVYKGNYSEKTIIKVDFFDIGYGSEWIYEQARDFVYENEEYAIFLNADSSLVSNFQKKLEAGKNLSDLYIVPDADWETFTAQNWLVPINDVYESKPDGEEGDTVHDKLTGMYQEAGYYTNEANPSTNGYYVLPWTQMVTGIAYNVDLFKEYGLEVPETMAEFKTVCDTIISKSNGKVAPIVIPGKIGGYTDFLIKNWWIQASGLEGVKEFFAYDSVEVFNPDKQPYAGYQRALEEFEKYFGGANNQFAKYVLNGSMSKDAYTAQSDFINGRAAMTVNANWLENEMINMVEDSEFNMKLMRVPFLEGAQQDEDGYVAVNYATSGFDFMCIPTKAKEVDGAKKFMTFMTRDSQLKSFTRTTGSVRPYDYDYNSLRGELSDFANSVLDILDSSSTTYFDYQTGPLRYNAQMNLTGMFWDRIINGNGNSARAYVEAEYAEAQVRWDRDWVK